jgi:hypothetical protein
MKEKDNRFACSDEKKSRIISTKTLTSLRRKSQVCKVFECKIVEKRLNKKQKEQLDMLFVEGKWFYNHILAMKKSGIQLKDINTTNIREVKHFDKNGSEIISDIEYLSSQ